MEINDIVVEIALKYSDQQAKLYDMLEEYSKNAAKYNIAEEDLVAVAAYIDLLREVEAEVVAMTEKNNG